MRTRVRLPSPPNFCQRSSRFFKRIAHPPGASYRAPSHGTWIESLANSELGSCSRGARWFFWLGGDGCFFCRRRSGCRRLLRGRRHLFRDSWRLFRGRLRAFGCRFNFYGSYDCFCFPGGNDGGLKRCIYFFLMQSFYSFLLFRRRCRYLLFNDVAWLLLLYGRFAWGIRKDEGRRMNMARQPKSTGHAGVVLYDGDRPWFMGVRPFGAGETKKQGGTTKGISEGVHIGCKMP